MPDKSDRPVRVRFAPSPTGSLHIGGLRTALFNWLFARHHDGKFILRIEDTDQKRFDLTALQTLTEALRWAGLQWDEGPEVEGPYGPYVQSERLEHYQQWANWLVKNGKAYKCFCTSERLTKVNQEKQARKEPTGYDRFCRDLSTSEIAERESQNLPYVIRLKMPLDGKTSVNDMILGEVEFDNSHIQDTVLLKSDGFPTYHLAHVVDDHLMEISHVMRANEWLPSVPVHIQLWKAFGWEMPVYAHLPVMLNPNGKGKMSKRNPPKDDKGNIIPVMVHDYIAAGYLPEAVNNFLVNIGWSFGDDREVFTIEEAIARFDGTRINPANGAFPANKLASINGKWIREMLSVSDLSDRLRPFLEQAGLQINDDILLKATPLIQQRIVTLAQGVDWLTPIVEDVQIADPMRLIQKNMDAEITAKVLNESYDVLLTLGDFSHGSQEQTLRALAERLELKPGQLFGVLRIAVTGRDVSAPLLETMEILGKETSLARIKAAASLLEQTVG